MHEQQDNSGATSIKYGLIAVGIVAAIVFVVQVTAPVGKGTFIGYEPTAQSVVLLRSFLHAHNQRLPSLAASII